MNYIPDIETKSLPEIKVYQEKKLQELLVYINSNSAFYRRVFREKKIDVASINYLEDLRNVPTTRKEDIQKFNREFLCVDRSKIKEYTSTSGTLGKPVTIGLTGEDVKRLAYNEYLSFSCAGVSDKDTFQLMLTLDRQFMAGIAYYEGLKKLGAGIIRIGPGSPELHWESILQYEPSGIIAVPSALLGLITFAKSNNIDINRTSVKKVICIGENIRTSDLKLNSLGQRILDHWNVILYSTYASTEMQTAFTECVHGVGGHHHPELIIVELVDENDAPVMDGTPGEIVVTPLGVEGMPLLRYKTGDIAIKYSEPCRCGRTTFRISPILGRKSHMIKFKGTTCYPQGVFDVIHKFKEVQDFAVEVYKNEIGTDELKIHLSANDLTTLVALMPQLKMAFKNSLRVIPEIIIVGQSRINELQEKGISRKLKRFIDNR